jgi:hypothetical protein
MRQATRQHLGGCLNSLCKEAVSALSLEKIYARKRYAREGWHQIGHYLKEVWGLRQGDLAASADKSDEGEERHRLEVRGGPVCRDRPSLCSGQRQPLLLRVLRPTLHQAASYLPPLAVLAGGSGQGP